MRNTFVKTIVKLAADHPHLVLMTGDLGYGVLTEFWESFPSQYINAGISEQNMTSVAAGMALEGKIVFTYSIGNFPTLRCLEQVRNDVAYHNANVKIVSIGAGLAYGGAGMSHHATEDLAIMRALPNITIYSPCDAIETEKAVEAAFHQEGPCYLRLGKGGENALHEPDCVIDITKASTIKPGTDICILSTGAVTENALHAAMDLEHDGLDVGVYSFAMVKPIDAAFISKCAENASLIITLEEHTIIGGLGGAVAEILSELPAKTAVHKRFGLHDTYSALVGSQTFLRNHYGLAAADLCNFIREFKGRVI